MRRVRRYEVAVSLVHDKRNIMLACECSERRQEAGRIYCTGLRIYLSARFESDAMESIPDYWGLQGQLPWFSR